MPNVAGVQFPYTPQGGEAAQQYQRSLSPGPGLGFRPIRMEQGGNAEARIIAKGLTDLMSDGTNEQVQAYINKNRSDLVEIAKIDDRMFDVVRLMLYGDEAVGVGGSQTMEEALFGATAGAGATIEDSVAASPGFDPETGDYYPPEREVLGNLGRQGSIMEARGQAGTGLPPYLGVPPSSEQFDDTTAIFNQRREPLRRLERRPEPWEFGDNPCFGVATLFHANRTKTEPRSW